MYGCGTRSYLYLKPGHFSSSIEKIDESQCQHMISTYSYTAPNYNIINGLRMNETVQTSVLVAGSVEEGG